MAHMEELGESMEKFAGDFVDRTRQLKTLVLLRSSQPSENTDQVLAELEVSLTKAERTMNQLKCRIAEECQAIRLAEALEAKSKLQMKHLEHCKRNAPDSVRRRLGEVQRKEEFAESSNKENITHNAERTRANRSVPPVSDAEMEAVPQYVKGRLQSTEKVNFAISEINALLATRASLLAQPLSKHSDAQLKQVNAWKELDATQANSKGGNVVFYESDLKATTLRVGEASSKDIVNVLKHLQKLKETRGPTGEKAYSCSCTSAL